MFVTGLSGPLLLPERCYVVVRINSEKQPPSFSVSSWHVDGNMVRL